MISMMSRKFRWTPQKSQVFMIFEKYSIFEKNLTYFRWTPQKSQVFRIFEKNKIFEKNLTSFRDPSKKLSFYDFRKNNDFKISIFEKSNFLSCIVTRHF